MSQDVVDTIFMSSNPHVKLTELINSRVTLHRQVTLRSGETSKAVCLKTSATAIPISNGTGIRNSFFSCAQYDISLREDTTSRGTLKYLTTAKIRSRMSWTKLSNALFQGKLFTGAGVLSHSLIAMSCRRSNFVFPGSSDCPEAMFIAHMTLGPEFWNNPDGIKLEL